MQLRSESAPGRVGFVWLDSDELRFETEELLAGPRAEAELQLGGFGALPLPLNGAVQNAPRHTLHQSTDGTHAAAHAFVCRRRHGCGC